MSLSVSAQNPLFLSIHVLTFALSCYNSLTVDALAGPQLVMCSKPRLQLCACMRKEDGWVDIGKCCDNEQERESAKKRVALVTTGKHREALCVYIVGLAP